MSSKLRELLEGQSGVGSPRTWGSQARCCVERGRPNSGESGGVERVWAKDWTEAADWTLGFEGGGDRTQRDWKGAGIKPGTWIPGEAHARRKLG